ncbi:MAG: dihydroorotate dehydrogenase (fumarate), partial [bacterium]
LVRHVGIPVVGIGGIATARDAIEFLITGATAVQLGTVLYIDPDAPRAVVAGLSDHLVARGLRDVNDLIGTLRGREERPAQPS